MAVLILLNIMFGTFIDVFRYSYSSFVLVLLYHSLSSYFWTFGLNNAVMDILVCISWGTCTTFILSIYQK